MFFVAGAQSPTVSGFWPLVLDRLRHLALPTIALTVLSYAGYHLLQRSLLLDTVDADYVRMARAKGLTRGEAIRRHGLRTSLIPVATSIAFTIPALFTGAVLTETIFGWEGMGRYFVTTISKNDVHGAVAVAAFGALMTAVGAILADLAVVALDPRVRVSVSANIPGLEPFVDDVASVPSEVDRNGARGDARRAGDGSTCAGFCATGERWSGWPSSPC